MIQIKGCNVISCECPRKFVLEFILKKDSVPSFSNSLCNIEFLVLQLYRDIIQASPTYPIEQVFFHNFSEMGILLKVINCNSLNCHLPLSYAPMVAVYLLFVTKGASLSMNVLTLIRPVSLSTFSQPAGSVNILYLYKTVTEKMAILCRQDDYN